MAQWQRANTDWFHAARWGTFVHYLADAPSCLRPMKLSVDSWNRRVDSFDVEHYAGALAELGCRYTFLTIGQNSGYYCSPNDTYDRIVGRRVSRLSRRDLIGELADACTRRGIRLLAYCTATAPFNDREAVVALRCTPPWSTDLIGFPPGWPPVTEAPYTDSRMSEFQRNWEAVIREWSLRWGRKVHGWWIDGAYAADLMYRHPDAPNFRSFAAAMKAGNPDAIVAFNPGVKTPVICHSECDDYTAGEIAGNLPTNGEEPCVLPLRRMVNGAQYHILTFLGGSWCHRVPRFSERMVVAYTEYVNSWGGVITWDHPVDDDGRIPENMYRQLAAIATAQRGVPSGKAAVRRGRRSATVRRGKRP